MHPADELKIQQFQEKIESVVKGASQITTLMTCVNDLYTLGRKIEKPENVTDKHAQALCTYWHELHLSLVTINARLSVLRKMSAHFGKTIRPLSFYLPGSSEELLRIRRTKIEAIEKVVLSADDIIGMVRAADATDWRFGLMFRMLVFDMTSQDILSNFRPGMAVDGKFLRVQGRLLRIETAAQRQILDMVATLLPEEKLLWSTQRNGKTANKKYCEGRYARLLAGIGMTPAKNQYLRNHRKDVANTMAEVIPPRLLKDGLLIY